VDFLHIKHNNKSYLDGPNQSTWKSRYLVVMGQQRLVYVFESEDVRPFFDE